MLAICKLHVTCFQTVEYYNFLIISFLDAELYASAG